MRVLGAAEGNAEDTALDRAVIAGVTTTVNFAIIP